MPVEIEAKYRIADVASVRTRLVELGARSQSYSLEVNQILDTPDRHLLSADRGLRLREVRPLDGRVRRSTLTFKGPRAAAALKSREELETRVEDAATAGAILQQLGYRTLIRYEKRRESWQLGTCEIALDELPRLDWWLEIEGPSAAAVLAVQRQLKLPDSCRVDETYVEMAARYGDEDERGCRSLTFAETPLAGA